MICRERKQSWFLCEIQSFENSFVGNKYVVVIIAWPRCKF